MTEYPQDKPRTVVCYVDGPSIGFMCAGCAVCAKWSALHNERPGEYILHTAWLQSTKSVQVPVAYNRDKGTWYTLKVQGQVTESEGGDLLVLPLVRD